MWLMLTRILKDGELRDVVVNMDQVVMIAPRKPDEEGPAPPGADVFYSVPTRIEGWTGRAVEIDMKSTTIAVTSTVDDLYDALDGRDPRL